MAGWNLEPAYAALADDFGSLDAVFALQGEHRVQASKVIRQGGVGRFQIPTRHQIASPYRCLRAYSFAAMRSSADNSAVCSARIWRSGCWK